MSTNYYYYDIMVFFHLKKKKIVAYSFLLNLTIVELKQILESCRIITINNNIVKFVINTSFYGDNCSWPMFLLKNLLSKNYFSKISLARYENKYQNDLYVFSLGVGCDTKVNLSTQFKFKKSVNVPN